MTTLLPHFTDEETEVRDYITRQVTRFVSSGAGIQTQVYLTFRAFALPLWSMLPSIKYI